jgi:hypothetical protein
MLGLAAFVGCATMPPGDLLSARDTYDRASRGATAPRDPADLNAARQALDLAEKSFAEVGDTQETRDLAYTSERRTEVAESRGRALELEQESMNLARIRADAVDREQPTAGGQ